MLTYHLKPHDQQPRYEQLYHAVRADIMSGALPGGTRLPSKRQLAANLRVSQITVETAYGQLAAEGYIASEPRRGYFVQEQLAVPVSEPQEPFAPPLPPISASEETYPYDFRTDFVDNGCFPFSTWARLSRRVLSEYSSALLRATDPCGAAELREEICLLYTSSSVRRKASRLPSSTSWSIWIRVRALSSVCAAAVRATSMWP